MLPKIELTYSDVEVEGVGVVRMRPLSRREILDFTSLFDQDVSAAEEWAVCHAIEDEAAVAWFNRLPYALSAAVFKAIIRMSKGRESAELEAALGN